MGKKNIKSIKSNINIDAKDNKYLYFLFAALLLRVLIAPFAKGYASDMNCFKYWSDYIVSKGPQNFYNTGVFTDYPPGYIYVLYVIGLIKKVMGLSYDSGAYILLIKLPSMLTDIAASFIVFKLAKKYMNYYAAIGLSMLYALNPAVIFNSTIWGQVDSFFSFFILLTIMLIAEDKLHYSAIAFAAAVLIKPQAFIFTPVILFAFIVKRNIKEFLISALYGILTFIVFIIPFSINQKPIWIIKLYMKTLGSYPYADLNAANFFGLLGANTKPIGNKLLFFSYGAWGYIFLIYIVAASLYLALKGKDVSRYYFMGTFLVISAFMFSAKMHERYLFPALILLLVTYIYTQKKRILYIYIGFSITHFINVAYVYNLAADNTFYIPSDDSLLIIISLINLVLFGLMVKTGIDIYVRDGFSGLKEGILKVNSINKYSSNGKHNESKTKDKDWNLDKTEDTEENKKYPLTKKDFVLMIGVTILYAVIALYNLGSLDTPQTYWKPSIQNESVYLDFGRSRTVDKMYYYYGYAKGSYNIYTSEDKKSWTLQNQILKDDNKDYMNVWTWNVQNNQFNTRYIRIDSLSSEGMLYEIGFFNNSKNPLKFKVIKYNHKDKNVLKAFDEQERIPYAPSYMKQMYFDEIYHARTAYESLHGVQPFEWTHPPLGKLLIAVGISIFGMNPFGWRIVGTLFGIFMIPIIYMFAKEIFKKTEYAFIAAFLMAFDFMHFTQTRIATIDVYGVFFIILMYYFMYKYINVDMEDAWSKKALIPLGLSGLFFGIGAASKWICIYAGAGLAIIFFKSWYDKYVNYKTLINLSKSNKPKAYKNNMTDKLSIYKNFPDIFTKTIGFSVIFFIVIPFAIYIASYIPFMMIKGPGHSISDVLNLQTTMYNYHKNLVATHAFSSKWWEWPLMIKPVWYYSGQAYLADGKISSIAAMGNPAVWWIGSALVIILSIMSFKLKDKKLNFILIGFFSQYLPWVPVPRLTFIYHFFASVPFIILLIVYGIKKLKERYPKNEYLTYGIYSYLGIVLILFIMFYPIMSGMIVDKSYVSTFLRWSSGWYFFS